MIDTVKLGGKVLFKSVDEAEQATTEAIRSVPPEFQYLAYFYAGDFQRDRGSDARDRRESSDERRNMRKLTLTTSRRIGRRWS